MILNIKQSQLKLDQPFSKQVYPGDELDIVEIVMAIEEELNIEISDSALDRAARVNGLSDLPKNLTIRKLQAVVAEAYKTSLSSPKKKMK